MEKYVKPEVEVVTFDAEDVIMASSCATDGCGLVGWAPDSDDSEFGG